MSVLSNTDPRELLALGTELIEREAVHLDEQDWDAWLALFTEDCEYWMPTWKSDGELTSSPRTELSHFYYASRAGLEDRISRIRSGHSPASTPAPRTTHILGNIRLLDSPGIGRFRLRSSWVSHVFFPRSHDNHAFHGRTEHELVQRDGIWLIVRKKIVLQNDYIPTMLDIYCV
jgi:3-phenylpropionate/cinnamic acid dioxygenase small subunit